MQTQGRGTYVYRAIQAAHNIACWMARPVVDVGLGGTGRISASSRLAIFSRSAVGIGECVSNALIIQLRQGEKRGRDPPACTIHNGL